MPKGIINFFIVELHQWIEDQDCVWKTGVVLQKNGARAEVIELYHLNEIRIRISGKNQLNLLAIIRHEFDKIHSRYKRLKYNSLVPCNCESCQGSQEPCFYNYSELSERKLLNKETIECRTPPFVNVSVSSLIDGVDSSNFNENSTKTLKKERIFISYSHKDKVWLDEFKVHLKPYVRNQVLSIWDDSTIAAGSEWFNEIIQALDMASLAVFLVSPFFLNSEFIYREELLPLLKKNKDKGLKIFWIPVSDCSYEETDIVNYQAAYSPDSPIDSLTSSERNTAWVNICKKLTNL